MKIKQGLAGLILAAAVAAGVTGCKAKEELKITKVTVTLPADYPVQKSETVKNIEGIDVKYRVCVSPESGTQYDEFLLFFNGFDKNRYLFLQGINGEYKLSDTGIDCSAPWQIRDERCAEYALSDKYPQLFYELMEHFDATSKPIAKAEQKKASPEQSLLDLMDAADKNARYDVNAGVVTATLKNGTVIKYEFDNKNWSEGTFKYDWGNMEKIQVVVNGNVQSEFANTLENEQLFANAYHHILEQKTKHQSALPNKVEQILKTLK
jgi:hypothetical protein